MRWPNEVPTKQACSGPAHLAAACLQGGEAQAHEQVTNMEVDNRLCFVRRCIQAAVALRKLAAGGIFLDLQAADNCSEAVLS